MTELAEMRLLCMKKLAGFLHRAAAALRNPLTDVSAAPDFMLESPV